MVMLLSQAMLLRFVSTGMGQKWACYCTVHTKGKKIMFGAVHRPGSCLDFYVELLEYLHVDSILDKLGYLALMLKKSALNMGCPSMYRTVHMRSKHS